MQSVEERMKANGIKDAWASRDITRDLSRNVGSSPTSPFWKNRVLPIDKTLHDC